MPELRPATPDLNLDPLVYIHDLEVRIAKLEAIVTQLVHDIRTWTDALIAPSPPPPGTLPLSADPNETEPSVI